MKIKLYDGKYTIIFNENPYEFRALRHGEEWRDLTGDGLILALVQEIEQLSKAPETKTGEKVCPECNANVFIKQMNHCDGCGNEWSL